LAEYASTEHPIDIQILTSEETLDDFGRQIGGVCKYRTSNCRSQIHTLSLPRIQRPNSPQLHCNKVGKEQMKHIISDLDLDSATEGELDGERGKH
jgi:hypothetical protein